MAANTGVLRWAYAVVNGIEGRSGRPGGKKPTKVGVKEAAKVASGKDEEEPEALRQLRSSVNGTLRRREELIEREG